MNCYQKIAILSLAAFPIWGESATHLYTGHIVNAKCMPAAEIVSRNSRGYTPTLGATAFMGAQQKPLNLGRMKKTILRHCALNVGVTEFALLESGGKFFRLDEPGNLQVFVQDIRDSKNTVVKIEGSVDRSILNVVSLSAQ